MLTVTFSDKHNVYSKYIMQKKAKRKTVCKLETNKTNTKKTGTSWNSTHRDHGNYNVGSDYSICLIFLHGLTMSSQNK